MSPFITVTISINMIITNVDMLLKLKLIFSVNVASTAHVQLICLLLSLKNFFFKISDPI